jgi:hypothetical protein
MAVVRRQIQEIAADPVLRWYGAALALVNALTAVHWTLVEPVRLILSPALAPICWPFLSNCALWRLDQAAVQPLIGVLFIGAVVNAALFLRRSVAAAWWALLALSALKAVLLFQDFRLILNQHYMAYWVTLPFLFLPGKRRALRYLIVLFYLWAGTLKLNPEWVSGLALYGRRPLNVPPALIPTSCVYVIALELGVVFGLFSKRGWVFWAALGQLVLFHIASFWVVGFFYPILMFLLLSLFPLARYLSGPICGATDGGGPIGLRPWLPRGEHRATYLLLGAFCAAQVAPFAFPGDPSITGEGRLFTLHMFDAPVECRATARLHTASQQARIIALRTPFLTPRISCDPIVYFSLAQDYCRDLGPGLDIDLTLESRKPDQPSFRTVVSIPSFCAIKPTYTIWRHNRWILATDGSPDVGPATDSRADQQRQ